MSLQVWLPLNGDLRNQGLSPESGLTSHSVSYPAGKMGYCLYTNGVKSASGTFENLKYLTSWSFSLWAKVSTDTPTAWADIFILGSNNDGNTGNIRLEHTGTAGQAQLICNKSATSGSNTNTYMGIGGLGANASDKWAHIVVTNDGTTIRSYLNGNVLASTAVSNTYPVGGLTGYVQLGATGAKGYLNDIRIYDHVLSTKEIKELSKGLMLHYTFNRGDYNAITNLLPYPTPGSAITPGWDTTLHTRAISVSGWSNGYNPGVTNSSGTKDPQVGYHAHWELINDIPTMVFPKLNYSVSGVTASRWLGISSVGALSGTLKTGTVYTVSFEAMADTEGRIIHGGYYYNNGSSTTFHDGSFYAKNIPVGKWKKYAFTFTAGTVSSGGTFYFYGMQGSNGTAYIRNPQVEVGAIAHDYVPNSKTKDTLIYDSSGMNYNGTITGTLSSVLEGNARTVDGSTTRNYEKNFYSSYFNGSSYVAYDTQMAIPDAYTVAFWIYKSSNGHVIDWRALSGEAGVQPVYLGDNKIQYYSSAGGSVYFDYTFSNNTWYHVAIAVTATTATLYVNGVKQQTVSATNPTGTIAAFHVGCRVSYANIMTMYMRDLRLYATTLTDEDIKQICKTPFIIDDEQNIYGRELREGSGE